MVARGRGAGHFRKGLGSERPRSEGEEVESGGVLSVREVRQRVAGLGRGGGRPVRRLGPWRALNQGLPRLALPFTKSPHPPLSSLPNQTFTEAAVSMAACVPVLSWSSFSRRKGGSPPSLDAPPASWEKGTAGFTPAPRGEHTQSCLRKASQGRPPSGGP